MAVIKCKVCGGSINLLSDKTIGVCDFCGSTITFPKIDDEQRAAAFNRGNDFRRMGEFDKALGVYERIIQEDDTDAEAHWCCALCRFGIEYVEDPATYEWLPTCHRLSFDSFLEDVDYKAALEYSDGVTRRQYQKDAAKIAEIQHGILATSQNTEPYDVFICYKETDENGQRTKDSLLAQDIYYQLTEQGRRVFFSRITLEEVPGTEYEPYIFAALNSAKVMVVVGTKAEYLNAVWVKNEWSRFLSMMRKDRSKLLLPCYRDMNPYDLPEQLAVLQSYDMSKIGFIQDLIRGIGKVLNAEKKKEVSEPVATRNENVGNTEALVKRGNMALEDGEWQKADHFFEEVLNRDAEIAEAYLGKCLVELRCRNIAELEILRTSIEPEDETEKISLTPSKDHVDEVLKRSVVKGYVDEAEILSLYEFESTYDSKVAVWKARRVSEEEYWNKHQYLSRAVRFSKGDIREIIHGARDRILSWIDKKIDAAIESEKEAKSEAENNYRKYLDSADSQADNLHYTGERNREKDYWNYEKIYNTSKDLKELEEASAFFHSQGDYKNSSTLASRCEDKIRNIKAAAKRKQGIVIGVVTIVIAICCGVYYVVSEIIIPKRDYNTALSFLNSEQYEDAAEAFEALGDYKDSADQAEFARERIEEIENAKAYEDAEGLFAANDFEAAIIAFDNLGSYRDSEQRRDEAIAAKNQRDYAKAEELFHQGNYTGAIAAFQALGNYSDSENRILEVRYAMADDLLAQGKKGDAAIAFFALKGYGDAGDRSTSLWNEIAVRRTVATDFAFDVAIRSDGTVMTVGSNANGQCNVAEWKDIIAVETGTVHTVGLRSDGTVVASGGQGPLSNEGQCDVKDWTDIVAIAAGAYHTVGLKADGTVVAVGDNDSNQCNVSDWTDIVAIAAGTNDTVGLKTDGTVVVTGGNVFDECNVSGWTDIVAIAAEFSNVIGVKADGTVEIAGANYYGEHEVSAWSDIVAVDAGDEHIVGLKSDGTIACAGRDSYGQCKVSDWSGIVTVSAGRSSTIGLKSDGTVVLVGYEATYPEQSQVSNWSNIMMPN